MNRPHKRNTLRERTTGFAFALLLFAGCWLLANALKMSGAQQRQARVLRELALERVVLPEVVATLESPRTPQEAPPPVAAAAREDMKALMQDALLERSLPETAALEQRTREYRQEVELLRENVPMPGRAERLPLSDDRGLTTPSGRRQPGRSARASGRDDERISLAGRLPEGHAFEERGRQPALAADDITRPIQRRETPPEPPAIKHIDRPARAEDALEVDELIRWMKLRPGALPSGIKRHVDWRDGNLTSAAIIEHEGERYELYLMARMPIREIHVVLVTGRQTYYLIDRSFQQEGRKFRAGTARRSDAVITGVVSEERAAGSPEAAHFYNVFLSWWQRERLRL